MTNPESPDALDPEITMLQEPAHEGVKTLLDYWNAKRPEGGIPDRSDIDPVDLGAIAPHLVLLDVVNGGEDFRVRLYGSELVHLTMEERTGKLVSEFGGGTRIENPARVRQRWLSVMRYAVGTRAPVLVSMPGSSTSRTYLTYHVACLPLTRGGDEVEQIIGALYTVSNVSP